MAKSKIGNKFLESCSKAVIKNMLGKAQKDFHSCANRANNIIHKEVTDMYDTLIEQFYLYKTTSYIRNWEFVPGTMEGQALKFGKKFWKDNDNRISPRLYIEFSGAEMDRQGAKHQHNTNDQVLNMVLDGARFKLQLGDSLHNVMTYDTSQMHYEGKYFRFSNGTIREAFDKFDREWEDTSRDVFYSMWGEYVNRWVGYIHKELF